jgi:hypothetical protein
MESHILAATQNGAVVGKTLVEPGVTVISTGNILDRNIRLHLLGIDLQLSGAGTVKFLLGSIEIFSRTLTAAGSIFEQEINLYNSADGQAKQSLTMTVVGSINITGNIFWGFEFAGGEVIRTAFDAF